MNNKPIRTHRRSNCGTAQKITVAYYILSQSIPESEKLESCINHPNLIGIEKAYEDQRYLFMFNDNSILGYDTNNSFYVADAWGRRDRGIRPCVVGSNVRKVVYV